MLKCGKEISISDILEAQFLMKTCFKDFELMKKRMIQPDYQEDPVFMNYFGWYNRVMKNIRIFVRKILKSTKKNATIVAPATTNF